MPDGKGARETGLVKLPNANATLAIVSETARSQNPLTVIGSGALFSLRLKRLLRALT